MPRALRLLVCAVICLLASPAMAVIPTSTNQVTYTCNGSTVAFTVTYKFLANTDLVVSKIDTAGGGTTILTYVSDYTVTGAGGASGTVTLISSAKCPIGYSLNIKRVVALTQGTAFSTQGSFNPKTHENAFDRLTMEAQQIDRDLDDQVTKEAGDVATLQATDSTNLATTLNAVAALNGTSHSVTSLSSALAYGSTTPRTLTARFGEVFRPLDYGAAGDGATDDTTALRATFAAAVAAGGGTVDLVGRQYRITGTLVIDGKTSVDGHGNSSILFDATTPSGYDGDSLDFTTIVHMGRDTIWSGHLHGVTFRQIGGAFARNLYGIVLRAASNWEISDCSFLDMKATIGGSWMPNQWHNTPEYLPGTTTMKVEHGRVVNNQWLYDPTNTVMEATSVTGTSSDILFQGNTMIGFGDDAIATHTGKNIRIIGNYIEAKYGRIILDGAENVVIFSNIFIKKNSIGSSAGITVYMPYEAAGYVKNVTIANNVIINDDATYNLVYPIEIKGVDGCVVTGNVMMNNRGAGQFTVNVIPANFAPNVYANKRLVITNNVVYGGNFSISHQTATVPGSLVVFGNIADGAGYASDPMYTRLIASEHGVGGYNYGFGGTTIPTTREAGDGYVSGQTIGTFGATGITTGSNLTLSGTSAVYLYTGYQIRLTRVRVTFSAALSAAADLHIYSYDGATDTEIATKPIGPGATYADIYYFDTQALYASQITVAAGLGLKLRITSTGAGGVDAYATVVAETSPY